MPRTFPELHRGQTSLLEELRRPPFRARIMPHRRKISPYLHTSKKSEAVQVVGFPDSLAWRYWHSGGVGVSRDSKPYMNKAPFL